MRRIACLNRCTTVPITLTDIARTIGVSPPDGDDRVITGIASLDDAGADQVSFLSSEKHTRRLGATRAAAVIIERKVKLRQPPTVRLLAVDDAELAVARVLALFAPPIPRPPVGSHPSAVIASSATIGPETRVGPHVVIGEGVRLGSRCTLHAGVVVGDDVTIGDDCELYANVVIRERISIGRGVIIHAGSVLGTDGFGYRWDGERHQKVPQIGTVIIEDDVEIGSCVCVDRAKFATTRIGRGTKIDNLVQIGHNVRIGEHCVIVGQTGIAGSAVLGSGVVLGGQTAVRDHIQIGDGAAAAARSAIAEDIPARTVVSGMPALPHRQSLREQAALRRLPELVTQLRRLQDEVKTLREAMGR